MSSNPNLSDSTTIVASEDCLSTEIDDESVILHIEGGTYYGFNRVGADIWNIVQEPHTVEEIYETIFEAYDVDKDRCKMDVRTLVSELLELDLVHTPDPQDEV
ncbi:PqqD family protein [Haloplanus ruber]|uniref:PqqD family protein n=1 Tax=Haloplanus ruber TaxID=869892 RepID=A0ABD6CXK7_9EURY|nr:PqqD family protein [Haloplanus ruber]